MSVGGDQGVYMTYWAGTEVQKIMQSKLSNITIGGTSAGLAVLGNWVYTAESGSVYSDEALAVRFYLVFFFISIFVLLFLIII